MYLCASLEASFTCVRYLLVAGGQVLNTGVAKRFIRSALWEEGEPYPRVIQVDHFALFLFTRFALPRTIVYL